MIFEGTRTEAFFRGLWNDGAHADFIAIMFQSSVEGVENKAAELGLAVTPRTFAREIAKGVTRAAAARARSRSSAHPQGTQHRAIRFNRYDLVMAKTMLAVEILPTLAKSVVERAERDIQYRRLRSAPGSTILALTRFVYSRRTFERVVEPCISDMRIEYCDALQEGRITKSRLVVLCGHLDCLKACLLQFPISILRLLLQLWRLGI